VGYKSISLATFVAKLCHQVNKAICEHNNDFGVKDWEECSDEQRESLYKAVLLILNSNNISLEEIHEEWMMHKLHQGWKYGEVKDEEKKTHPCLVPYDQLPESQKLKDLVFKVICDQFKIRE